MIQPSGRLTTPATAWRRDVGAYLLTALLSALTLVWAMELWRADLRIPFAYARGGDLLPHAMMVKGTIDHGWFLHNPDLSMPTGLFLHDYGDVCNLPFLIVKTIALWTDDPGLALNLYFMLTFPLTALTSLWAWRRLGTSWPMAVSSSLLYTFLPYHFLRGESHLFLASYFMVPTMVVVSLWIASGEPLVSARGTVRGWLRSRAFAGFALCLVTASGTAYYSFFAAYLLLVSGLVAFFREKSPAHLLAAAALSATLFVGLLVNVLPNMIYIHRNGKTDVAQRAPGDAEIFGLKIAQLLLPPPDHRVPLLGRARSAYDRKAPPLLNNENVTSTLGSIGNLGFLVLLASLFGARAPASDPGRLWRLSRLNLAALLLGTIGGFSSLFAIFISPQIRAYNRLSVFVAFFALAAVALVIDGLFGGTQRGTRSRALAAWLVATVVTAAGLFDQVTPSVARPPYADDKERYRIDADFVRRLESRLPVGAMIFQLPYRYFPEGAPRVERMVVYDHLRPYLHSEGLRWSFGAIRSREADLWQRRVSALPIDAMAREVAAAGFAGIYVDRYAYPDSAADLLGQLRRVAGGDPLLSVDERMAYFDLGTLRGKTE